MKVFGIISKDKDIKRASWCANLLKRNKHEIKQRYVGKDYVIFLITRTFDMITDRTQLLACDDFNDRQFSFIHLSDKRKLIKMDRMGISKLYYYEGEKELIFSSEMKTIIQYVGRENLTVDKDFIFRMITFGFPYRDQTLFNEIKNLLPDISMLYDKEGLELIDRHIPTVRPDPNVLFTLLKNRTVLHESINQQSFLWLSGGLDSRVLFKLLSDSEPINNIINFGYDGTKERRYAKNYAFRNKTVNLTTYEITPEMIMENYVNHIYVTEGLSGHLNSHIYNTVKKFKNNPYMVIYDGYAGDVILGGNYHNKGNFIRNNVWYLDPVLRKKEWMYWSTETIWHQDCMRNITASGGIKIGREFGSVIYPFADYDFFIRCMEIPLSRRRKHKYYKTFLRRFLPDVLKTRSTTLEAQSLFHRAKNKLAKKLGIYKQGYVNPDKWLRENHEYRKLIYNTLLSDRCKERGYFNHRKIKAVYKRHVNNEGNYGAILAKLFDLEVMFKQLLDGEKND